MTELIKQYLEYYSKDKPYAKEMCVGYGLHAFSLEYMLEALCLALNSLDDLYSSSKFNKYQVLRMTSEWKWDTNNYLMHKQTTWPVHSMFTPNAVLLSTQYNPVKVNQFIKACKKLEEWMIHGGELPDMKFPYTRDMQKAYQELSAEVTMRKLAV